jgi:hypothetical protein
MENYISLRFDEYSRPNIPLAKKKNLSAEENQYGIKAVLSNGHLVEVKVKGRVWGIFGTAACRLIVPLPPISSPHSSPEARRTT